MKIQMLAACAALLAMGPAVGCRDVIAKDGGPGKVGEWTYHARQDQITRVRTYTVQGPRWHIGLGGAGPVLSCSEGKNVKFQNLFLTDERRDVMLLAESVMQIDDMPHHEISGGQRLQRGLVEKIMREMTGGMVLRRRAEGKAPQEIPLKGFAESTRLLALHCIVGGGWIEQRPPSAKRSVSEEAPGGVAERVRGIEDTGSLAECAMRRTDNAVEDHPDEPHWERVRRAVEECEALQRRREKNARTFTLMQKQHAEWQAAQRKKKERARETLAEWFPKER